MHPDLTPFQELEDLLRLYDYVSQADLVAEARTRIASNDSAAWQSLATLEWWGGAGSIADILLYGFRPSNQTEDNRRHRTALIRIYDLMRANGADFERAKFWTDVFRKWQADGV